MTVLNIGKIIMPDFNQVYLAKLVSIVPYVLLIIMSLTKVRKKWGNYISGMCLLCLVGVGNLITYGVEVRMYSWALFFVFGTMIEFFSVIE